MNFYEQLFSRGRTTGEGMTHFERLFAAKFGGSPPPEVREYTGAVPVTITADGTPLIDYLITGNTVQNGIPSPSAPIPVVGVGVLDSGQYKIPISSAGQTTPIYLGEVESTRRIKKLVLDGTENWLMNADGWFYLTSVSDDYLRSEGNITSMCSHYPTYKQSSAIVQLPEDYTGFSWGSVQRLYLKDTAHRNDLSSFKQWVAAQYAAGTPVCVWYVLATEETAVVNEPLMKIDDYADTLSKAQAGVSIPTNNGSTTVDVSTELKPSEIYIKYMG